MELDSLQKRSSKKRTTPSNQELNFSFLEAIFLQCTLSFKSPASLDRFAATAASALPQPGSGEAMTRLSIELDMFRDDQLPNASELEEWKTTFIPHGFPQDAREYFIKWMDAVQKAFGPWAHAPRYHPVSKALPMLFGSS
ncbi:uncharacterized protein FMAN_00282 [Fusarium mangiferae]|uniref:Uncharacterized protein n=1 Tax=Fusarium mangiferae TaxID=192010 RepID=A0A1L7TW78_FUSMA|nr:uncharacterized protein FMAN_00282 [Fusarium mangiferae]CVL02838.1 uncharacterized protein FMAN_00282 [Fusarium mangiferae]